MTKTNGMIISYSYGPDGNRISKITSMGGLDRSTYYVRDAGGNVMSIYTRVSSGGTTITALGQSEIHFYGSSRLGIYTVNVDVQNCAVLAPEITYFRRGDKAYELTNHLGNVLVTVSDKKIGVDANSDGQIDYYMADIVTATDYSSFGASLPGREYNFDKTIHGFNSQLRDKDIQKDHHTALFWEYDPRLGRRWNIDPVPKSMVSPYVCLGKNPIMFIDPLGNDWYHNKKSHNTEWFDTRKEARQAGYKKHLGTNFYNNTDNPNTKIWYGSSKDDMHTYTFGENVTITAKAKPKSLIARSAWGMQIDADAREYRRLTPYRDMYNLRRRDGEALVKTGDPIDYTNNLRTFETGYQIRKGFRDGGAIAAGFFTAPFAILAAAESGATYYLYQGGSWVVRNYGASFMQEVAKEGIANRGNILKMDWSDVLVSTILNKSRLAGAHGMAEIINATTDLSIEGGFQNSFLRGTKYEKRLDKTASDLFFGGMRIRYSGTYSEMALDQVQTQTDILMKW